MLDMGPTPSLPAPCLSSPNLGASPHPPPQADLLVAQPEEMIPPVHLYVQPPRTAAHLPAHLWLGQRSPHAMWTFLDFSYPLGMSESCHHLSLTQLRAAMWGSSWEGDERTLPSLPVLLHLLLMAPQNPGSGRASDMSTPLPMHSRVS